ncbi:glycoside hydrolase superfamily [Flammula alnicola]|nr:glycoside hydrolase superfamily [Flammula alnicola]
MFSISLAAAAAGLIAFGAKNPVYALSNGVARLPTWNAYQCNIDEDLMLTTAKLMKSLGLQEAGYNFVNIDDCWAEKNRTASGDIIEDQVRFKNGMKNLTNRSTPLDFPYDSITRQGIVGKYQRMSDALTQVGKAVGRNFVFSFWGAELGHSWRTTGDIAPQWDSLASIINFGNGGLTFEEAKSHWTAWALMKSPLLLSAITPDILGILTNKESISPFRWGINPDWTSNSTYPAQYWSGPLNLEPSSCLYLNTLNEPASMTFNLTESPFIRAGRQYSVRDLWAHTDNGTAVRNFTAENVPPHGVVALLLKDAGDEPADKNGTNVGG